jgi:S1-C subfamily serine protease
MRSDVNKYYNSVVRIMSYSDVFDFENPYSKGKNVKAFGSGFFIDKDGHILTCSHVVEGASKVCVNIPKEGLKEYDVEIRGVCPYFDLAVLKIKNYNVKSYLKLHSKSMNIKPGAETIAIGFPLGQENMKITKGVVSGQQSNYYQIDTPINEGNSGGPLIYEDKVIGVNAAGIQTAASIGFAVPISRYYLIIDDIKKKDHLIFYPNHLFDFQKTGEEFKKCSGSKCTGGILITKIFSDSLLKISDMKEGDLLCQINGNNIDYYANMNLTWMGQKMSVENMLSNIQINSNVKFKYWRDGKMYEYSLKFKENETYIREVYPNLEKIDYYVYGGLVFMNLSLNHLRNMSLVNESNIKYAEREHGTSKKVIIVNILLHSTAYQMNIFKSGDIIKCINSKKIETLCQVRKALSAENRGCKDFIIIQNEKNQMIVLNREKVIEENAKLKELYKYS